MTLHRSTRLPGLALLCLSVCSLFGCGDKPRPANDAPATAAPPSGLRPLTSRDGSTTTAPAENPAPAGQLPPGHPPIANRAPEGGDSAGTVSGTIDVAPARKAAIQGGALFVIARNAKTHQIVAVRREPGTSFPLPFSLSAADVMMAGVNFEGPFDVTARWSKSGDAMPGSGDIEGTVRGVAIGATNVKLVLSDVRP